MFECQLVVEVWNLLGVHYVINKAILIDRAAKVVVEYLLSLPDHDVQVLGLPKFKETIATAWYLWWERRKLTHVEEVQSAKPN